MVSLPPATPAIGFLLKRSEERYATAEVANVQVCLSSPRLDSDPARDILAQSVDARVRDDQVAERSLDVESVVERRDSHVT